MAVVRRATPEDTEGLIDLIHNFNAEYFDVPLSEAKARAVLEWLLPEGVVLISGAGFIGGLVTQDLFRDWSVLQEFGWYSEDRSGIALLDAFIEAGRDLRVNEVRISTLTTSSPHVEALLRKRGFAPLELSHRLVIGA